MRVLTGAVVALACFVSGTSAGGAPFFGGNGGLQSPGSKYNSYPAHMPETLPKEFPNFGAALPKPDQGQNGPEHKHPLQEQFGVGLVKFQDGPGSKYNKDPAQMPETLPMEFPMFVAAPATPKESGHGPEHKDSLHDKFDVGLVKFKDGPRSKYNKDPAQMPEMLPEDFARFGSAPAKGTQGGHGQEHKDPSHSTFGVGLGKFEDGPRSKYNKDPARMPETLPFEFHV